MQAAPFQTLSDRMVELRFMSRCRGGTVTWNRSEVGMKSRRVIMACAVVTLSWISSAPPSRAADDVLKFQSRVLDCLFPLGVEWRPYYRRVAVRFSEPARQ